VVPAGLISLDGNVRIERLDERTNPNCDYLTLALLDSPRVQSVTTVTAEKDKTSNVNRAAAFTLVSANADSTTGIFPVEPGEIVREYPPLARSKSGKSFLAAKKAVEADWAVRLAGQERLREAKPIAADKADWVIRVESRSKFPTTKLRRVTILDAQGNVRFRKSYRKEAIPAHIFYVGLRVDFASLSNYASFHIGREIRQSGEQTLKPEAELLQAIQFKVPRCDETVVQSLQREALNALDDPAANSARLDLARRYLGLFYFDAKPQDLPLIARIVADDRVRDIEPQLTNVFSTKKTPLEMRDSFLRRITMNHSSASLRDWLGQCLANLPAGTFADCGPAYQQIWDSPETCQQAGPLIATLADLPPDQAMPMLDEIIDYAVELPHWNDRRAMIHGIRTAMIRMGTTASAAVPKIQELYLRRPSPIMNNARDASEWRFALARMGVAAEDLPVFPGQSRDSIERNRQDVVDKIRRFDQANVLANR
ncbi:MAG: hypothetical protein KDA87_25875, partial [Planctomycetales bacterium]|nr:hypothetical protein [Planctomycetales bacterium]